MTKLQGWVLIGLLALGGCYYLYKESNSGPTELQLAMKEHYRQKCVINGDCEDWRRVRD